MTEHDEHLAFDDPAVTDPDAGAWEEEPADEGWSPVMGTPPPDAPPIVEDVDIVPPHEVADDTLPPPLPDPGGELGAPPPPPPTDDELPPALPEEPLADPVDLSAAGGVDAPPMPPVTGDAGTAAPPAPGEVDLGDDGPPLAPAAPGDVADGQSPVPPMGDQSPVPTMGGPQATTPDTPGDIALDDGPPMPPGIGDGQAEAPPTGTDDGAIELPVEPGAEDPAPTPDVVDTTEVSEEILMSVTPGDERISAAALTGALLDEMGLDDPARERMIGILAEYATDGSITEDELYDAFAQAGFEDTPTNGSDEVITQVLAPEDDLPRTALVRVDGEGLGVFRISEVDGVVELESLRTGAVYAADRSVVVDAWRDSGARVITAPAPVDVPAIDLAAAAEPEAAPEDDGSGSGARNLLLAGAVLLPLAGGGAYLATRKIR